MNNKIQKKTAVRAILPTTGIYSRGIDYQVSSRNPNEIDLNEIPPETFAITFYDFFYTEVEEDGIVYPLKSEEFNPSPVIFLKGRLMDREQIASDYPDMATNIVRQMNEFNLNYSVLVDGKFKVFNNTDIFWPREDHKQKYLNGITKQD
jgi:hypothetical protein